MGLLAVHFDVQDLFDSCEGGLISSDKFCFQQIYSNMPLFTILQHSFFYSPNLEKAIAGGSNDSVTPPTLIYSVAFTTVTITIQCAAKLWTLQLLGHRNEGSQFQNHSIFLSVSRPKYSQANKYLVLLLNYIFGCQKTQSFSIFKHFSSPIGIKRKTNALPERILVDKAYFMIARSPDVRSFVEDRFH